MKIDLLVGDNLYGTTRHFADGLKCALERLGVDARLFWIAEGNFFHAFYTMWDDPPDLTCSFSDLTVEGKPLSRMWSIPHLSLLVDPPIYFLHQLTGEKSWISCVDRYDCEFVESLNFRNVFFLPHGVDHQEVTPVDNERPLDFVFFGGCGDYEKIAQAWNRQEREFLLAPADRVLSPEGLSLAQALIELEVNSSDFPRLHGELDRYTRSRDRIELLKRIPSNALHIWGEGCWKKYLPNATIHPAIPFAETLQIMKQSKIVLNSSPRFKAGSHERIISAFICGAAVITGRTPYLEEHFPELYFYEFGLRELPSSFTDWQKRAALGQQQTLSSHTWDHRAATLLKKIEL